VRTSLPSALKRRLTGRRRLQRSSPRGGLPCEDALFEEGGDEGVVSRREVGQEAEKQRRKTRQAAHPNGSSLTTRNVSAVLSAWSRARTACSKTGMDTLSRFTRNSAKDAMSAWHCAPRMPSRLKRVRERKGRIWKNRRIEIETDDPSAGGQPDQGRRVHRIGRVFNHPLRRRVRHELIRQGKKDLVVSEDICGWDADLLVGAGCVRKLIGSGGSLDTFGPIRGRWRLPQKKIEWEEYSNLGLSSNTWPGRWACPICHQEHAGFRLVKYLPPEAYVKRRVRSPARNSFSSGLNPDWGSFMCSGRIHGKRPDDGPRWTTSNSAGHQKR